MLERRGVGDIVVVVTRLAQVEDVCRELLRGGRRTAPEKRKSKAN